MASVNAEQYPHVRAMRTCLSCGGAKHVGLLVCWQCHNELTMDYDRGYGPVVERVLNVAQTLAAKREQSITKL